MLLFLWFSLLVKVTLGFETNDLGAFCRCTVRGDPHYRTFDGQHITFAGHCKYVLFSTKQRALLDPMKVEVKNKKRGHVKIPYTERMDITMGESLVQFLHQSIVKVNGTNVTLPYTSRDFNVTKEMGYMRLMTKNKVIITYDGRQRGRVLLPLCYAGKIRGICGDCNGLKDDYRLKNGTHVDLHQKKFNLIAESYRVQDENDDDPICRKEVASLRLRRHTLPFNVYEDLIQMCNILIANGLLEFKQPSNNQTLQSDTLRKVCNRIDDFKRTTCKDSRSVFLTCDAPKLRQRRAVHPDQDFYTINKTHFLRVSEADVIGAYIHSVTVSRSLHICLTGCLILKSCIAIVFIQHITCVYYEKASKQIEVVESTSRDVFLRIKNNLHDFVTVPGGYKPFPSDMLIHCTLPKCIQICQHCDNCESIQYFDKDNTCMVFLGIGENGPVKVKSGWTYIGMLKRMCKKECARNARCMRGPTGISYCQCDDGFVGDGDSLCAKNKESAFQLQMG